MSLVPLTQAVDLNPKLDRSTLADDIEVSFVPMAAVEAASGRMDAGTIRRYAEVKKGYTHFRDGDVLFAKITPCMENGKMAVAHNLRNGIGLGSTEFHVLRSREGVDPHYVYHFVSSRRYRSEAAHHMTGAVGQKRVPLSFLEQSQIPLPKLDQQRCIVAEIEKQFSRLDEAVAGLQRVKANLKRYKAAILKAAVEGRLVPTEADLARREDRNYETGTQLLRRILEARRSRWQGKGRYKEPAEPDTTDLPELPEGWVWSSFEQITLELTNGYGKRSQADGKPYVVVRLADIVDSKISYADVRKLNCLPDEAGKYALQANDFIVIRVNGSSDLVGRFVLVRRVSGTVLYCDHFIRGRCVMPVLAVWLSEYGDVESFRRYIDLNKVSSAGQNTISQGVLSRCPIPLPPLAEQHRIVAEVDRRLSIVREVEAEVEANLKRAQTLRQTVLQTAFTS